MGRTLQLLVMREGTDQTTAAAAFSLHFSLKQAGIVFLRDEWRFSARLPVGEDAGWSDDEERAVDVLLLLRRRVKVEREGGMRRGEKKEDADNQEGVMKKAASGKASAARTIRWPSRAMHCTVLPAPKKATVAGGEQETKRATRCFSSYFIVPWAAGC